MNKANEFERLLQQHQDNLSGVVTAEKMSELKNSGLRKPLKADKSASLYDFIKMVSKVVALALKDKGVEFVPDEGKRLVIDPQVPLEHPYITYKVVDRSPKGELKPRERETLIVENTDNETDARKGRVYGQKFKCIVQFNIIASEYSEADEVMNTFEDLMMSYAHYFKKNGVAELLFEKHFTDENFDIFRQTVSVRSLQYYVEVEKLTVMFDQEIEVIQSK